MIEDFEKTLWSMATSITLHNEDDLLQYNGFLYHYTTMTGLLGILESQKIWATESLYLSDTNEINYGISLVKDVISEMFQSSESDLERRIAVGIQESISERFEEIYIACFSEDGDLLSQWKGYANFGDGASIQFDVARLSRFKRKFPHFQISIRKVLYELEEQKLLVKSQINKWLSEFHRLLKNNPEIENELISTCVHSVAYVLGYFALFFKNKAFAEEREWRAIYINSEHSEEGRQIVKFRSTEGMIIPYIPLDIGDSAQKKQWTLPISTIIFGAKVNRELADKSIKMLCKTYDLTVPKLDTSKIPLR